MLGEALDGPRLYPGGPELKGIAMASARRGVGVIALVILLVALDFPFGAPYAFGTSELPATYPEVECATAPRFLGDVIVLAESAERRRDDGYPPIFIEAIPTGVLADARTVGAITGVVLETTACARDNDRLRLFALFTDRYIVELAGSEKAFIDNLEATPVSQQPVNPDLHVAAIQDVVHLDDGRVSAIVTLGGIEDSHPAPGRTVLMIFAEQDGRWLLDGQYERVWADDSATSPVYIADVIGTPVAPLATPRP